MRAETGLRQARPSLGLPSPAFALACLPPPRACRQSLRPRSYIVSTLATIAGTASPRCKPWPFCRAAHPRVAHTQLTTMTASEWSERMMQAHTTATNMGAERDAGSTGKRADRAFKAERPFNGSAVK